MSRPTHADALRATAAALVALADSLDAAPVEAPRPAGESWVDGRSCAPLRRRKFLALIAAGELPAVADGRRWLVRRSDLDAFLAGRIERREAPTSTTARDRWLEGRLAARGMKLVGGGR